MKKIVIGLCLLIAICPLAFASGATGVDGATQANNFIDYAHHEVHAGSGKKSGGDSRSSGEIMLKQNTKYWVDITNSTTSDNYIGWSVIWYEHTNKN